MSRHVLRNRLALTVLALALALAGGAGWLHAQNAQKGSVSGTVLSVDGKPMVGLALRLERTEPIGAGDGGGSKRKRAAGWDNGAEGLQGVKIVGRATTDQQG